jgi:hypothetical protein
MCLGRKTVLPMPYDTHNRRYIVDENYLTPAMRQRVIDDSLKLVNALGYDMNTVEWAIKDGIPYAIDFMNPAPDMDINSLTPAYFEWVVHQMADLVIDRATNPQPQLTELRWAKLF